MLEIGSSCVFHSFSYSFSVRKLPYTIFCRTPSLFQCSKVQHVRSLSESSSLSNYSLISRMATVISVISFSDRVLLVPVVAYRHSASATRCFIPAGCNTSSSSWENRKCHFSSLRVSILRVNIQQKMWQIFLIANCVPFNYRFGIMTSQNDIMALFASCIIAIPGSCLWFRSIPQILSRPSSCSGFSTYPILLLQISVSGVIQSLRLDKAYTRRTRVTSFNFLAG